MGEKFSPTSSLLKSQSIRNTEGSFLSSLPGATSNRSSHRDRSPGSGEGLAQRDGWDCSDAGARAGGSLLVGLSFAKSLSFASGIPFVGVNHVEGHLSAIFLEKERPSFPFIGLVVSGGHTSLYRVDGFGKYKRMGQTRDDAAGRLLTKSQSSWAWDIREDRSSISFRSQAIRKRFDFRGPPSGKIHMTSVSAASKRLSSIM